MDQVLSDRLIAAFPHLYRSWQDRDMRQVWRTRQDFECGDGWFEVLWQLSAHLDTLIAKLPVSDQDAYAPTNIKEKFGGLRFYMTKRTPEMDHAIRRTEGQSIRTCEQCGKPGMQLKENHLILTRCPEHAPPTSEPWQPWDDSHLPAQLPDVQVEP